MYDVYVKYVLYVVRVMCIYFRLSAYLCCVIHVGYVFMYVMRVGVLGLLCMYVYTYVCKYVCNVCIVYVYVCYVILMCISFVLIICYVRTICLVL